MGRACGTDCLAPSVTELIASGKHGTHRLGAKPENGKAGGHGRTGVGQRRPAGMLGR